MIERRRTPRAPLDDDELWVDVQTTDGSARAGGRVCDASDLGFGLELTEPLPLAPGEAVHIHFRDLGAARGLEVNGLVCICDVRRISGHTLGVEASLLDTEIRERLADLVWERTERRRREVA